MPQEELPSDSPLETEPQVPITEASINTVNGSVTTVRSICAKCGQPSSQFCPHCGQDFCHDHRCIMHDEGFKTESHPLTDEDGVTHKGRRIRLIGEGWPNELSMIKDLTDDELEKQIHGLQKMLEDCVRTGDYARICIAHREYELGYRRNSRYVAAIKRREKLVQGSVRLNSKKFKKEDTIPTDIAQLMKAFNISKEQAMAMKVLLAGAKKS
jgi:hypothetical protein